MKLVIKQETLSLLNAIRGERLLMGGDILVIESFQYQIEKPEEVDPNSSRRVRRNKKKPKITLTELNIVGYNADMKYMGSYNEDFCTSLVTQHDSTHYTLSLRTFRKEWIELDEQIIAMNDYDVKMARQKEESK